MTDWLGFPSHFTTPGSRANVPLSVRCVPLFLGPLLNSEGDGIACEATEVSLWYDEDALHMRARCSAADMDRVRKLVSKNPPYTRDTWGDDALEAQIDVGLTRREYAHIILTPTGAVVTYRGFNNRQTQGWHPAVDSHVTLEDDAWVVDATFPFAELGRTPKEGEVWGFNLLRVNPAEPGGYVQWAPTFGDALRPELFGALTFAGAMDPGALNALAARQAEERAVDIAAYAGRAAERNSYFFANINGIDDEDTLAALGIADWAAWAEHLSRRRSPQPLRWDACVAGADGIPEPDRSIAMEAADSLVHKVREWTLDPPQPEAFFLERLEALGDAYLLNGEPAYAQAFEQALRVHERLIAQRLAAITTARAHHVAEGLYHDYQVIRAAILAYVYLGMQTAGLSPQTHATVMRTVLRIGRFAAFNIRTAYNYGNHQLYESAGLAIVAALCPEFDESDEWERIASRAIRLHLEAEVLPDGGYMERCGYHSVAMDMTMQAVATIRANALESRFSELMSPETLDRLARMHEWALAVSAPDGTMPAFGDYGAYSQIRFLRRGAAVFARPNLAWQVQQLAPSFVPPGIEPTRPDTRSVAMEHSGFTIMRDGWERDSFYMAVDHGPLGGQHSHVDTMGFVAYAHGRPVALDTGIGRSYGDPRYLTWFRDVRAHNTVAVDDVQPEKAARRTGWHVEDQVEVLDMQSDGYRHALGIVHDRRIVFVKGVGWLIWDRLRGTEAGSLNDRRIDWMLHTPFDLKQTAAGELHSTESDGGLLLLAARPDDLEEPVLEKRPAAVPVAAAVAMRLQDACSRFADDLVQDITCLTWRRKPADEPVEFAFFVLPYRGERPAARFTPAEAGWDLHVGDGRVFALSR